MTTNHVADQLGNALAEAFDDLGLARGVAATAGIPRNEQPIEQPNMRAWWLETIRVAWRDGKLVALVDVAAADPTASQFAPAFAALRNAVVELQGQPAPAAGLSLAIPPTPPAPPAVFGRKPFLKKLATELAEDGEKPITLFGTPGVGKSEVALALADRADVKARFPDGRAWLPIGPNPNLAELLGRLLQQFGAPADDIPSKEARADRLRQTLDGKACLVILPSVWDDNDVWPFLQAIRPPARALLTTGGEEIGRQLGAVNFEVLPLDLASAVQVLADAGSYARKAVRVNEDEAREFAATLGGLSMTLRVAGCQLEQLARLEGPEAALPLLARDLQHLLSESASYGSGGVTSLPDTENPTIRAILEVSYQHLEADAQRAFRRLGVFGGQHAEFDAGALAALWGTDDSATRKLRAELIDSGLLELIVHRGSDVRRHALNPVMSQYAAELLSADPAELADARARLPAYSAAAPPAP